jgi:hypothetical protein
MFAGVLNRTLVVNNIYSKTITETISGSDTNNLFVISRTNSSTLVVFKLSHVPIANSVRAICRGSGSQFPLVPFENASQNLLFTYWEGSDPRANSYVFEYVNNSRDTNLMSEANIQVLIQTIISISR